ncbi:MAG: hypothetical protein C0502_06650 [Opitutus sp.]|nr:hypothetical protein [Opitutus sp.]
MPVSLFRSIHTLEVTATHVATARFARRGGRLRLERVLCEPVAAPGETAEALTKLRLRAGRCGPVTLVLPAPLTLTKFIKVPRLSGAKRTKVIGFAAQEAIPHPLAEVAWDQTKVGDTPGGEIELLLGASKLEKAQPLLDAVLAAGFAVRDCLPAQLALHAAARGAGERGAPPLLVIDLDASGAALALLDGRKFHLRAFRFGEDGLPTRGALAWEEGATRLAQEITRTSLFFDREGRAMPRRILLTGHAEIAHAAFAELLSARTGVPAGLLDPLAGVEVATPRRTDDRESLSRLAPHVGAALTRFQRELPVLDLLPSGMRAVREGRARRAWLAAAAVLAAAALLPPVLHFRAIENELRRQTAEAEAVIAPLRSRESDIRVRQERLASLQGQISTLQSVQDRRNSWRAFLADLQERTAESGDVWLERLQVEPGEPLRLLVAGRVLARASPNAKDHPDGFGRVNSLLGRLAQSPYVAAVERERFDQQQPGLLHFDFVLVGKPAGSL